MNFPPHEIMIDLAVLVWVYFSRKMVRLARDLLSNKIDHWKICESKKDGQCSIVWMILFHYYMIHQPSVSSWECERNVMQGDIFLPTHRSTHFQNDQGIQTSKTSTTIIPILYTCFYQAYYSHWRFFFTKMQDDCEAHPAQHGQLHCERAATPPGWVPPPPTWLWVETLQDKDEKGRRGFTTPMKCCKSYGKQSKTRQFTKLNATSPDISKFYITKNTFHAVFLTSIFLVESLFTHKQCC